MEKHYNYKNLRNNIFGLLFLCVISIGFSQESDYLVSTSQFPFSTDLLENMYFLSNQDTLQKYTKNNVVQEDYIYSNSSLGKITSFDTSNPLRILVSHGEFSTLVLLDVTLRETHQIYLPQIGIYSNPVAYCIANDNSIWLFDDVNVNLFQITYDGKRIFESQSFVQDLGFVPIVKSMQCSANYLVLYDEKKGFIICDQFGHFIKLIPQNQVKDYQLVQNTLYYLHENTLIAYPLKMYARKNMFTFPKETFMFTLTNQTLFYQTAKGVYKRSLNKNSQ